MSDVNAKVIKKNSIFNPLGNDDISARSIIK